MTRPTGGERWPQVVVVQATLPQYRIPFFRALRDRLLEDHVALRVLYGPDGAGQASKGDAGSLEWAEEVPVDRWRLGRREAIWQRVLPRVRGADLVVIEQAVKNVAGVWLFVRHLLGGSPVALWGHGRNFQASHARSIEERVKRTASRRAHWWFAYNRLSADVVLELGYPGERISVVNNAIDTSALADRRARVEPGEIERWRHRHAVRGRNVCVYAGGLYAAKRLPFLIEAARLLRDADPEFELVVLGGGPEHADLERIAEPLPWLHVLGPTFGDEKVVAFAASRLLLMPGLVGLAVLDALALQTPMVAIDGPNHGPEIAYLDPDANGVLLPASTSPTTYASAVAGLLGDESRRQRLVAGCRMGANRYTVEDMAERFADGVLRALRAPPYRGR